MTPTTDEADLSTEQIINEIEDRIDTIEHAIAQSVDQHQLPNPTNPETEKAILSEIEHATHMAGLQARRDTLYDHLESFEEDAKAEPAD